MALQAAGDLYAGKDSAELSGVMACSCSQACCCLCWLALLFLRHAELLYGIN